MSILLPSCSDQNPIFSKLGLSAQAPKVNQPKIKIIKEYFDTAFTISGECSAKIDTLYIQFLGNSDWQMPSELGITGDHSCSDDGLYSLTGKATDFSFKDLNDFRTITLKIRGENTFGESGISTIELEYLESNNDLLKAELSAAALSTNSVSLTFKHNDPLRITSMELWRKLGRVDLDCSNKASWSGSATNLKTTSSASDSFEDSGLTSGTEYTYVVCSSDTEYARVSTSNVESVITNLEVNHFKLSTQSLWGEYAKNDDEQDYYKSSNLITECDPSAATKISSCTHLGEMKTVKLNAFGSCEGLSYRDTLGLFHWVCEVESGSGNLIFTAQGFKEGQSLASAIDMTSLTWKKNKFVVKKDSFEVSSVEQAWWENTIEEIVSSSQALTQSKTVYVYKGAEADASVGNIQISANSIAVVVAPNTALGRSDSDFVIKSQNYDYLWIEGAFAYASVGSTNNGIDIYNSRFLTLSNIKSFKNSQFGISLNTVKYARLYNIDSSFNKIGIGILNSQGINLQKIKATNNDNSGIKIIAGSSDISANNLILSSHSLGGLTNESNLLGNNFFSFITSINNQWGIKNTVQSTGSKYLYNIYTNNNEKGIVFGDLYAGSDQTNNYFSYLSILNNSSDGLVLDSLDNATTFYKGDIIYESNPAEADCSSNNGTAGCPINTVKTGTDYGNSLVGKLGLKTLSANLLKTSDFDFQNSHSFWTKKTINTFPSLSYLNSCLLGDCSDFDASYKKSNSMLSKAYDPLGSNLEFYLNEVCPVSATDSSDKALGTYFGDANRFMLFAYEINTDFVGNNNGVCEDYERCVWTSNIGAYQGHGSLDYGKTCRGPNLPNVKLIAYPLNGR